MMPGDRTDPMVRWDEWAAHDSHRNRLLRYWINGILLAGTAAVVALALMSWDVGVVLVAVTGAAVVAVVAVTAWFVLGAEHHPNPWADRDKKEGGV